MTPHRAARGRRLALSLSLAVLGAPSLAWSGDFVDTRLTVTFGDDDVLAKAGERSADTPLPGFGDRPGYQLFYDNLNSRDTGRETLTHMVVYKRMPGHWASVTTEAAMVVLLQLQHAATTNATLLDSGSFVRLHWAAWGNPREGISLTAFPFDSDRLRLGYLYRLSVGGAELVPRKSWIGAPGLRLQLDVGPGSYHLSLKALPAETFGPTGGPGTEAFSYETQYTGLAGASWDLAGGMLHLDLGAGFFQQGDNPIRDLAGKNVFTVGGSGRIVAHRGLPIEESIDTTLYRNDPSRPLLFFRPVQYQRGQIGWLASAEVVGLAQRLGNPLEYKDTVLQRALAAAVQARLQVSYWRLEVTAAYEDLAFLLRTSPGFVPFQALPPSAEVRPQLFLAATSDYHFPRAHLTLGLSAGVLFPASLTSELTGTVLGTSDPAPALIGRATVVVGESGTTILPADQATPVPVLHTRLQLRADFSDLLYALAWVQYRRDGNASTLALNPDLTKTRVHAEPNQLGFGVAAAVRY